jgi:hypothetical protein
MYSPEVHQTMEFLQRLLPSSGLYCTARLHPGGGFIHSFHPTPADAMQHLVSMDAAGHTMYLAQGTFSMDSYENWNFNKTLPKGTPKDQRKKERTQKQVLALRSFFIDIDCGPEKFAKDPGKSYPTQLDALKDVRRFCRETSFPFPAIVSSGHGLYAHWIISEDVPAPQWKALADIFKNLLGKHSFRQDPSRTSDSASVLRPVGTHNRKTSDIKEVKVLQDASSLPLVEFTHLLSAAAKSAKVEALALARPTEFRGINDEFTAGIDGPPASGQKVAEKCAQLRLVRDRRGDVPEPVWYAAIGLLRHCEQGDELIHEWSKGHPDYSWEVTEDKIQHHVDSGAGPTTCAKFGQETPQLCVGCPSANKIKSPIVLGRPEAPVAEAVTEEEETFQPYGYRRTENGLYFEADEAAPLRFYPYDLYPTKIAMDQSLGYETVTIRHQLPVTKEYQEFTLRSALLHDQKTMLMHLADNHVQVSGKEERHHMTTYLDNYLQKLRSMKTLATLHSQMGWRQEGLELTFVLGQTTYRPNGEEEVTGFAKNIPEVAKAFHPQGELQMWADATKAFSLPGMEPLAFAFLAGAFGAPLMRFTGYAGAVVALVGHSGIGKTLVGEWILSTYGDPRALALMKNDTVNALISRLGLYGSLPLYLDEVSNIEGQDLSDLLYRVTQGRDKARLGRDSREKAILNSWNTIAVASSNHSLVDKLSNLKADASAEVNRIMEVVCHPVPGFDRNRATGVYRAFHENYGVAGPEYVRYLMENQECHRDKIDALSKKIDAMSNATSDERFWSAMSAVAIYGGLIARKLGLIQFEVSPILSWLVDQIKDMREDKNELITSQVDVLGQFIDEASAGIMVTSGDDTRICSVIREPRGPLIGRIMIEKNILLISRNALKKYLDRHYGSYTELKNELSDLGALKNSSMRRVLGAGTYVGGTQQPCWVIDLNCPALGRRVLASVSSLEERKKVV